VVEVRCGIEVLALGWLVEKEEWLWTKKVIEQLALHKGRTHI
jgi:hypothetical protein